MKLARSLFSACLLALVLAQYSAASDPHARDGLVPRQRTTSNTSTGTATGTQQTDRETSTSSETTKSNTSSTRSTPTSVETTPPPSNTGRPTPPVTTPPPSSVTDEVEKTVTTVTTRTNTSAAASNTAAKPSATPKEGISTGSIIGMSVAGGVAILGIVAFLIWKLTRKRFASFDDNEAIQWPDLNRHGNKDTYPLPVNNTGRAGFETNSEADLSRVPSESYTGDAHRDPYSVPPLPHMNPNMNQPYRDDPTGATGYYDPYRGPIPGTLENGGSSGPEWHNAGHGEAIAMNQLGAPPVPGMGRVSPAPHSLYDYGAGGRASPAPQNPYGGRASPGPGMAYGAGAPGMGGRASPGPQVAYAGQMPPGANMGYGAQGGYGVPR